MVEFHEGIKRSTLNGGSRHQNKEEEKVGSQNARAHQGNARMWNRANRTRVRTLMKRLRTAVTASDAIAAGNLLQPTLSAIDRAISKGVLHENTGNRYKSRLALAHNGLKANAAK
jgi:small subunit ribosomal protein S20